VTAALVDQEQAALDVALGAGGIRAVYQPIIDLGSSQVVAYEALARGPIGSALERPDLLFAQARRQGRLDDLDARCRDAAVDGALGVLDDRLALFVNVEPESLLGETPLFERFAAAMGPKPRLVVEVTERAITARPAELIAMADGARRLGFAIALDDLGADPASLALLPLLAPDVIKLDLSLIQGRPSVEAARIHAAVSAENERSGAIVLAEGIETAAHLRSARALGATLGQGYLFGRPGKLGTRSAARPLELPAGSRAAVTPGATPFDVVASQRPSLVATKDTLIAMSKLLEEQAAHLESPGVCLSAFQVARNLTPATVDRYQGLAVTSSLVAVFAADLAPGAVAGVRTGTLGPADRLRGEWSVVVLGSHHAAALVAKDLGDGGRDDHRRYEYALTHDRALTVQAALTLMARIDPDARPTPNS